jgi:hypothetical protein
MLQGMALSKIFLFWACTLMALGASCQMAGAAPALHISALRVDSVTATGAIISYRVSPARAMCSVRNHALVHAHPGQKVTIVCRLAHLSARQSSIARDITAPLVIALPSVVEATSPLTSVGVDASARDAVTGPAPAICTAAGRPLPALLDLGVHDVVCSARDLRGNLGRIATIVRVIDTTAPSIIADPARTVSTGTSVSASALGITALDVADPAPRVVCTAAASAIAAPLTVACTATDASGNSSTFRSVYEPAHTDTGTDQTQTIPVAAPAVLDAKVGALGSDPVMLPAPNASVGWRLIGAPSSALTVAGSTYSYESSGWRLDGRGVIGHVKENITVTAHQGQRVWSWQLLRGADDAVPMLAGDGSVHLGAGVIIAPPVITNAAGAALAVHVAWQLSGSTLSLQFDDSAIALPYVIDPATSYPSAAFLSGPANGSMEGPGAKTWTFDFADGGNPITSVECYLDSQPLNLCSLATRSVTTSYLNEGGHDLDIYARTSAGRAWARRSIIVDSSPPTFPAELGHDAYQTLPTMSAGESLPACMHPWETPAKPEFSVNWFGTQDLRTGISGFRVLLDGSLVATLPSSAYGYHFSGLTDGSHTLRIEATNNAGLTASKDLQVVVDTAPPTLDESLFTMGSFASVHTPGPVTFELPGADDHCLRSYSLLITGHQPLILSGGQTQYTVNLPTGNYSWRVVPLDGLGQTPLVTMAWRTLYVGLL